MIELQLTLPIAKMDAEAKVVYGVVMKCSKQFDDHGRPTDYQDTDGNWATDREIQKACHHFNRKLLSQKSKKAGVDQQHNELPGYGVVLESYIAKSDIPDIQARTGDWVAAVEVTDLDTWEGIQNQEITGFSIGGRAVIHADQGE